MPDALSKTVPIWCAVLNRALFPERKEYHAVRLPPNYLGESEESQIASRIDGFVHSLQVCSSMTVGRRPTPAHNIDHPQGPPHPYAAHYTPLTFPFARGVPASPRCWM